MSKDECLMNASCSDFDFTLVRAHLVPKLLLGHASPRSSSFAACAPAGVHELGRNLELRESTCPSGSLGTRSWAFVIRHSSFFRHCASTFSQAPAWIHLILALSASVDSPSRANTATTLGTQVF